MLKLSHRHSHGQGLEYQQKVFGLVIEEVDGLKQEYTRIGHFEYQTCEECELQGVPAQTFARFWEIMSRDHAEITRITLI